MSVLYPLDHLCSYWASVPVETPGGCLNFNGQWQRAETDPNKRDLGKSMTPEV